MLGQRAKVLDSKMKYIVTRLIITRKMTDKVKKQIEVSERYVEVPKMQVDITGICHFSKDISLSIRKVDRSIRKADRSIKNVGQYKEYRPVC